MLQTGQEVSKDPLKLSLSLAVWARKSSSFYRTVGETIRQSINSSSALFQPVAHKGNKICGLIAKISRIVQIEQVQLEIPT